MKLTIAGEAIFKVQNLKKGNEITSTMRSGEFVIGEGVVVPFVLQRIVRGNIACLCTDSPLRVAIIRPGVNKTAFTKAGYVSLLITIMITAETIQLYAYIKKDELRNFFAAFCMATI